MDTNDLTENFEFSLPTEIKFGTGILSKLGEIVAGMEIDRALLITDSGVIKAGLGEKIEKILEKGNITYRIYDKVEANPKDFNVKEGAEIARDMNAQLLIALGGGSPIDCTKGICISANAEDKKVRDFEGEAEIEFSPLPSVAIPTTAGTGSEVTFSSVITDTAEKTKFSIRSKKIAPNWALVDPKLTETMPKSVAASTGVDALTHAIEAFTVKPGTFMSDTFATKAIELLADNLRPAVIGEKDKDSLAAVSAGSLLAGISFNNADVGSVHCMAESLGSLYDAPHGACNSILLPYVMEYNKNFCTTKYAKIADIFECGFEGEKEGAEKANQHVKELKEDLGLPTLKDLGVEKGDLEKLAEMSENNISNPSNPRPMSKEDYLKLFEKAYGKD